jgi:hypothetical protein
MVKKFVYHAEAKEGWLVEPLVKFKIKMYLDKEKKAEQKGKNIVLDFHGLYYKDKDGESLPSLRIVMENDEAKRFAEKILQLI